MRQIGRVLAEEGLAFEDEGRDAPMARRFELRLVRGDLGVEGLGVGFGLAIELGRIEAGAPGRRREMAVKMPVFGPANGA